MDENLVFALEYSLKRPESQWLSNLVNNSRGKLILNPGSADGSAVTHLFYKNGANIVSLDLNMSHLKNNPHPKIRADALKLPFKNNVFDFVISEGLILDTIYDLNLYKIA